MDIILEKINDFLNELEDYKNLSIKDQKCNTDFRILINTSFKNLIYNTPLLKQIYEDRVNYFENLENDTEFKILICKINSIKQSLLRSIDANSLDNFRNKRIDDAFARAEIETKEKSEKNLVPQIIKTLNKLKTSKIRKEIELNKKTLLDFLQQNNQDWSISESVYNFASSLFYFNSYFFGGYSASENPFEAADVIKKFNDANYIIYNPEEEKDKYIHSMEGTLNRIDGSQYIKTKLTKFLLYIEAFYDKNFINDRQLVERLIAEYRTSLDKLDNFIITTPDNIYFKYFNDINNYYTLWCDNSIYKAAKEVLKQFKIHIQSNTISEIKKQRNYYDLTDREKEVADLIIEGKQDKEIASILKISVETAKTHVKNINKKLGTNSRTEIIAKILGTT